MTTGKTPPKAIIDKIMDRAVRNMAARYNLNDAQTVETKKLMEREVYRFLREHEEVVWPVIRKLLIHQLQPPEDQKQRMELGKAARPLLEAAQEAIFDANKLWREYLTDEQKRVHDFDLEEMRKTFKKMDENFEHMARGEPSDDRIFPQPELGGQPPRPPKPEGPDLPTPRWEFLPNKIFATLVERFIKEYELDDGQITSARSILEEFKAKANDFRARNQSAFAKIAEQQEEALTDHDIPGIKKAHASRKKLLGPVYGLVGEMNGRLKGLLTTAQIERHKEQAKAAAKLDTDTAEKGAKQTAVTKKTSEKARAVPAKPEGAQAVPVKPNGESTSGTD